MIDQAAHNPPTFEQMHAAWRAHLKEMAGDHDIRGIEIGSAIRMLANYYESAINQNDDFSDLSGPRMAILIRLMGEENFGNPEGINPTRISQVQNVSKNTISALLRGLEEKGLVERRLDPGDRRRFIIRITPAGRALVHATGPARIQFMNHLVTALNSEEQDQLLSLLDKLRQSLLSCSYAAESNKNGDVESEHHR